MNKYNEKYKLIGFSLGENLLANIMLLSTGRSFKVPVHLIVNSEICEDLNPQENREIYKKLYKGKSTTTTYDLKDRRESYWTIYAVICTMLASIFIFCTVSGIKPVSIESLHIIIPAAILVYPITFVIVDILNEFYGIRLARLSILITFIVNCLFCASLWGVDALPSIDQWGMKEEFSEITRSITSVLIASSMSYLISENVNAYILYKIKSFTNSKYLYIRVLTSTILAAAIDSILFITIAFHDSFDNSIIEKMIITQFLIKSTYALIGVLPIYAIRWAFNEYIAVKQ